MVEISSDQNLARPSPSTLDGKHNHETDMLNAALYYASLGWNVFPVHSIGDNGNCTCGKSDCNSPGKHPRLPNGCKAAQSNEDVVRAWWETTHAGANIGLHCDGDIWAFDVDPKDDGDVSLNRLEAAHGSLPETVTSLTGGGGQHYFFRKTPDAEIRNRVKAQPGLDCRSTGGYVVLPPSRHASGGTYQWEADRAPGDLEIPSAPEWLKELFSRSNGTRKKSNQTSQPNRQNYEPLPDGDVHAILAHLNPDMAYDEWISVGMALHSGDYDLDMWDRWSSRGKKYVDTKDCTAHWNTFGTGEITMGTLIHMGEKKGWVPPWKRLHREKTDWPLSPAPTQSVSTAPKAFVSSPPTGFFEPPGIVKDFADYMTNVGRMPQPILSIGATLTAMATILGNKFSTETGLRPNLMVIGIGPTSSGKDAARKGVKEIFNQSGLIERIGGEDVTSGSAIESALGREANSLFLFDEFGMMLKVINDPRAGGHQKEIASMLMKMFSSSGSNYIGRVYATQVANNDRIRVDISYPCLSLYATTTGEKLDEALRSGDAVSGFLNRFLVVETDTPVPDPQTPSPLCDLPDSILNWIAEIEALERPGEGNLSQTESNAASTIVVQKSEEAAKLIQEFECDVIDRRRRRDDEVEHSLWGRAVELVDKVAMILAVGEDPSRLQISLSHAGWAIEFVTWSIDQMSRRVREFVADTETEADIKRLVRYVSDAASYTGDSRYGQACAAGVMPHSKLLKLSKMRKRDFNELVSTATEAGYIEPMELAREVHGIEGAAYRVI